jgi:cell division FtsZ-interacting protein ZapD
MKSDLFQTISQRSSIPGGTCSFDLPSYHYWLEQEKQRQDEDLNMWINQAGIEHLYLPVWVWYCRCKHS